MRIQAVQSYSNNMYTQKNASPAFGAVKGLGDTGENLLLMLDEFIKKNGAQNNIFGTKFNELKSLYDSIATSKIEKNKLAVIAKLKELKMQILDFYLNTKTESSILTHKVNLASQEDEIKPSIIQGFGFGKIAGYDDIKNILNREFISKIKQEKEGKKVKIPGVFAFFGPRGNGKTTSALAIAEETGCAIERLDARPFDEPKIVIERLRKVFQQCSDKFDQKGRHIIFMDEFTKFSREAEGRKMFADLLKDCSEKYHSTFFGATNNLSQAGEEFMAINPVLVAFEPPSKYNTIQILKYYLQDSANNNINYSEAADKILELAKQSGGLINNSRLREMSKLIKSQTKKVDTKDIIETATQYINNKTIIPPDYLKNFKSDYEKYMN